MRLQENSCPAVYRVSGRLAFASAAGNGESGEMTKQKQKTRSGRNRPAGVYLLFFRLHAELIQLKGGPALPELSEEVGLASLPVAQVFVL